MDMNSARHGPSWSVLGPGSVACGPVWRSVRVFFETARNALRQSWCMDEKEKNKNAYVCREVIGVHGALGVVKVSNKPCGLSLTARLQ